MGIVASNKKVLEINETYLPWQGPRGGRDEAHDATAAGGGSQGGEPVSAQPQEREELDLERTGRVDGIQSCLFQQSTAPTRSTHEARAAIIDSGRAVALKAVSQTVYDEQVKAALVKIWRVMDYDAETPSFAWRTEDCPLWGALLLNYLEEEAMMTWPQVL